MIVQLSSGRWLAGFGAVVFVLLGVSTLRYLERRELAAAVADELQVARAALGDARRAERTRATLAMQAFSAFDTGRRNDGERVWHTVVAQRDGADHAYRNASRHVEIASAKGSVRPDQAVRWPRGHARCRRPLEDRAGSLLSPLHRGLGPARRLRGPGAPGDPGLAAVPGHRCVGEDATAYAAWLDCTGRIPGARLCSEVEWERAARGADGRAYPAGHPLEPDDSNVDVTHGPRLMGPDEVGSHPGSRSPFGLDDMSGNAFEWTVSEDAGYVLRGGGYMYDRKTAHLANRCLMNATVRDATVGLRLCATPPQHR